MQSFAKRGRLNVSTVTATSSTTQIQTVMIACNVAFASLTARSVCDTLRTYLCELVVVLECIVSFVACAENEFRSSREALCDVVKISTSSLPLVLLNACH